MKKIKSYVLLESLSRVELKRFNDFINYSVKAGESKIKNLWAVIYSAQHNKFDIEKGSRFSRKTFSDFTKQIEKFLFIRNLEKDTFSSIIFLSKELRQRKVNKYFEQQLKYIDSIKNQKNVKIYSDVLNRLRLNREELLLFKSRNDDSSIRRIQGERTRLTELLMIQNILSEYCSNLLAGYRQDERGEKFVGVKRAVAYIRKNQSVFKNRYPGIYSLYLFVNASGRLSPKKNVDLLFEYLIEHENKLSDDELQSGYEALILMLIGRLNSGDSKSIREFYDIIKEIYNRGILRRHEVIQSRLLPTFVNIALEFNNIPLAENLILEFDSKMDEITRQPAVCLCRAMVECKKRNFLKAKKLLLQEKPHGFVQYVFNKTVLIIVYYELNELRNIYPMTDTIKHFLQRRTELKGLADNVLRFLKHINKLARVKKNNGKGIQHLYPLATDEKLFFHRPWILEKYEELSN